MSPVLLPPPVRIGKAQAEEFIDAVYETLLSLPNDDIQEIYLFQDRAAVISYSSEYQPFLGFTSGLNVPNHRLYINKDTYLLTRIGEALDSQGRDTPGGRVFIDSKCAYIKDADFNHIVILCFDWQADNLYEATKIVYDEVANKIH